MNQLESGLVKGEIKITCFYYELEQKCIDIVNIYCLSSEENQKEFDDFSKNYYTFRPYFDFVVCVLGYKVLNPELKANTVLYGKDNHMYICTEEKPNPTDFYCGLSDNLTLDIYPMKMDSSTFHDCLIDWNCNHLFPKDMYGHVHIFQQLLNLLLISSKSICEEYVNYNSDIGFFVQRYLPLIRFQADKLGKSVITREVIRDDNCTESQRNFITCLLDNRYTYPSFILDASREDIYENSRNVIADLEYRQISSINQRL